MIGCDYGSLKENNCNKTDTNEKCYCPEGFY